MSTSMYTAEHYHAVHPMCSVHGVLQTVQPFNINRHSNCFIIIIITIIITKKMSMASQNWNECGLLLKYFFMFNISLVQLYAGEALETAIIIIITTIHRLCCHFSTCA